MKKKWISLLLVTLLCLSGCGSAVPANTTDFTSVPGNASNTKTTSSAQASEEYRAMWISYLELKSFAGMDEATFRQSAAQMLQNCVDMGLNTVVVQVRPFGDALYNSQIFPQSHIVATEQGNPIGYDPLLIFIEEGHARNLKVEAWVNPYRIQLSSTQPATLSAQNPAVLHPEWTLQANGGLYYDPALPEVRQLVVDGVKEIVSNYDVDGIHFDDYFYPTTDEAFDRDSYAKFANGMPLDEWRRNNVNLLIQQVYKTIKEIKPNVRFGISPQGNNGNNYNQQYSDVCLWLKEPGYVDYIMPQLYWGFDYLTSSQRTDYQFAGLSKQWADYPRHESVQLYIGLGAWRIGDGDGGSNEQTEWSSGTNLAKMVETLRQAGCDGFALYRYDSLYSSAYPELAAAERAALSNLLNPAV